MHPFGLPKMTWLTGERSTPRSFSGRRRSTTSSRRGEGSRSGRPPGQPGQSQFPSARRGDATTQREHYDKVTLMQQSRRLRITLVRPGLRVWFAGSVWCTWQHVVGGRERRDPHGSQQGRTGHPRLPVSPWLVHALSAVCDAAQPCSMPVHSRAPADSLDDAPAPRSFPSPPP